MTLSTSFLLAGRNSTCMGGNLSSSKFCSRKMSILAFQSLRDITSMGFPTLTGNSSLLPDQDSNCLVLLLQHCICQPTVDLRMQDWGTRKEVFSSAGLQFHVTNYQALFVKQDFNFCSRLVDFADKLSTEVRAQFQRPLDEGKLVAKIDFQLQWIRWTWLPEVWPLV